MPVTKLENAAGFGAGQRATWHMLSAALYTYLRPDISCGPRDVFSCPEIVFICMASHLDPSGGQVAVHFMPVFFC